MNIVNAFLQRVEEFMESLSCTMLNEWFVITNVEDIVKVFKGKLQKDYTAKTIKQMM